VLRSLPAPREATLAEARQLLAGIRDALVRFGAAKDDEATMAASMRQLDELFLLVVVGEFNAGKSAFINALTGHTVLPEGVTPTTARIHLLKYGPAPATRTGADGIEVVEAPVELLRDLHIVDTPGTNAIHREHERLTTDFVPRSDLVLFVTSADRPFTETERRFLEGIRDWGKKIVIVINKADIFQTPAELDEVVRFVRDAARRLLGIDPEVFPVSARLAQRAKAGEPSLWAASRFEPLEAYLRETLGDESRFQLKLANPLGVAQALAGRYAAIAEERLTLLGDDLSLLDDIERELSVYRADLARGFELRIAAVEKALIEMEGRGHRFVEDTMRLARILDLLNRARVQKEFEEQVVADAPRQIEHRVTELIDWLIDEDFRQWQAITSRLTARERRHASQPIGAPEIGSFHTDRSRLVESVGREAQRVVDTYDKRREAEAMADQARVAVATAAAAGGAAVGLGALVTIVASTVAADITGLVMAGVLAGVGFLVIPARRRRARQELQDKVTALRAQLAGALREEFDRARDRSVQRIETAVAPYSRFVKAEAGRWRSAQADLAVLRDHAIGALRALALPPPAGDRRHSSRGA
jgi:small GTP-binding protein